MINVIARAVAREHWENVADNLKKAGWSWGCVSAIDSNGRTIWIADAHRDDGKRLRFRLNALDSVASVRSKPRSTCGSTVVAVSLRSQMLYPVELRAPERESVNLRSNDRTVKSCWKKNTTALKIRID